MCGVECMCDVMNECVVCVCVCGMRVCEQMCSLFRLFYQVCMCEGM